LRLSRICGISDKQHRDKQRQRQALGPKAAFHHAGLISFRLFDRVDVSFDFSGLHHALLNGYQPFTVLSCLREVRILAYLREARPRRHGDGEAKSNSETLLSVIMARTSFCRLLG